MKTLLAGIAAAASLGVMSGAAMQPDLEMGARPAGPQYYAGGDARVAGPFEDSPLQIAQTAYISGGKAPDYVYGTDWTRISEPERYEVIPAQPVFVTYNDPPHEMDEPAERYEPGDAPPEAFTPAETEDQAAAGVQDPEDLG
ncbi:hypothetical protein [Phenylobacterium immobile]|uniref:hypothetical protein n=1 Tax=Phenylobacterium immobile TaxID=21 RepID=UPI000B0009BF|nr:hypothetical protein [Phenylobacterium immobile]